MKITEEELIEELESWRDNAEEQLKEYYRIMNPQNSYGVGFECGIKDTCERILHYMKDGWGGENYENK